MKGVTKCSQGSPLALKKPFFFPLFFFPLKHFPSRCWPECGAQIPSSGCCQRATKQLLHTFISVLQAEPGWEPTYLEAQKQLLAFWLLRRSQINRLTINRERISFFPSVEKWCSRVICSAPLIWRLCFIAGLSRKSFLASIPLSREGFFGLFFCTAVVGQRFSCRCQPWSCVIHGWGEPTGCIYSSSAVVAQESVPGCLRVAVLPCFKDVL